MTSVPTGCPGRHRDEGEPQARLQGTPDDIELGAAIAWLGDTDGDGCPEFAALCVAGVRVWAVRGPD